ncbi:MAG TPA: hypothetical protein VKT83_03680 [bacterium]|nr:hypothetical protein [bacterium]
MLKMVAKKGVTATLKAGDQAEEQAVRREVITELQAQMRYLDGHLVRVVGFFERNSNLPSGSTIAQVSPSAAREFGELRRALLGTARDVERAVFDVAPYLRDDEREIMARRMRDVRGILHHVLCDNTDPLVDQAGQIRNAHRIVAADIDGLRP